MTSTFLRAAVRCNLLYRQGACSTVSKGTQLASRNITSTTTTTVTTTATLNIHNNDNNSRSTVTSTALRPPSLSSLMQWRRDYNYYRKYTQHRFHSSSSTPSSSSSSQSVFRTGFDFFGSTGDGNNDDGSYNPARTSTTQYNDDDEEEEELTDREKLRKKGVEKLHQLEDQRAQLRSTKKGRGWTDPWDIEPFIETGADFEALLDWTPEYVSRISQERVQIYNRDGRTVPTLLELANEIPLPLPAPPNPVHQMKAYALYRKRYISKYIYSRVVDYAEPKVSSILMLQDWDSKQDAIDILYEQVEFALREQEIIMSKLPNFGLLVERALEQYLRSVQKLIKERPTASVTSSGTDATTAAATTSTNGIALISPEQQKIEQRKQDERAVPIFMDCYNKDIDKPDVPVPTILIPMKGSVPLKPMVGRMVEEWELSAFKTSKRIMLRQCTRTIAQHIVTAIADIASDTSTKDHIPNNNETLATATSRLESHDAVPESSVTPAVLADAKNIVTVPSTVGISTPPSSTRILVHGAQGVGKTAVLASIVACARQSGAIVLFIPDGNQMHQNGFYIEPDDKRNGIYNLPILSQTVCRHLIESHENDMKDMMVDEDIIETYFTEAQIGQLNEYEKGKSMNLVTLINHGVERTELAPMCYSAAMHILMQQNDKDFIIVLDEANCFYIPQGHYYHESYDYHVKKAIPYHQINLFEPILNTMNITALKPNDDHYSPTIHIYDDNDDANATTSKKSFLPSNIQRGAVIMSTTESHAIPRIVTDNLIANAKIVSASSTKTVPLQMIEVPRLTAIEVQHMLSNYEATGVGNLRLDRGETVMNQNEVSYLHMVSGGIPQHLMNACMI